MIVNCSELFQLVDRFRENEINSETPLGHSLPLAVAVEFSLIELMLQFNALLPLFAILSAIREPLSYPQGANISTIYERYTEYHGR